MHLPSFTAQEKNDEAHVIMPYMKTIEKASFSSFLRHFPASSWTCFESRCAVGRQPSAHRQTDHLPATSTSAGRALPVRDRHHADILEIWCRRPHLRAAAKMPPPRRRAVTAHRRSPERTSTRRDLGGASSSARLASGGGGVRTGHERRASAGARRWWV